MKHLRLTTLFVLLFSVASGIEAFVILSDSAHFVSIAQQARILEDEEHKITFDDLVNNPEDYAGRFKKIEIRSRCWRPTGVR